MSKEKIKDRKISKESILFHNELPNETINKIKLLIDNSNSGNDKFNLVKDIYKKQIDNAVSLINDGYKIDVVLDDENNLNSYLFIGYIYKENLLNNKCENEEEKKCFHNFVDQFSYRRYDGNKKFISTDEMFKFLKSLFVKKDFTYNNEKGSILPVIFLNQYKAYNSMLQINSNIFYYYFENKEKFVNNTYIADENPYIFYIDNLHNMVDSQLNDGKSIWDDDGKKDLILIKDFSIKNADMSIFDDQICQNYISFCILWTILKTKLFHMYIPVYIKRNTNELTESTNKLKNSESDKKPHGTPNKNEENENNKNKFLLEKHISYYYDNDFNYDNEELNNYIKVYNDWFENDDESLRLDSDFCKTAFQVHYVDAINVGMIEITFYIRFISPKRIGTCLNRFYEDSYMWKEVLNVVSKYNSEKKIKIELFDDLEYNHFLAINNYYYIDYGNKDINYLRNINEKLKYESFCDLYISPIEKNTCYLGKKSGLIVGWIEEKEFSFSLLKYFIINNLSNSLIGELINMKNSNTFNINCEKTLLNLDKEYLEFSMLSSRDLYSSDIDYNKVEEYDKKFHIEDIDMQYKKNLEMYKEIVDIESKKQGNSLANKLNTIQIMSILLTIIGWGLVIAQANILNKTLNYFIIITFAAISGLLAAIFINNFISNK